MRRDDWIEARLTKARERLAVVKRKIAEAKYRAHIDWDPAWGGLGRRPPSGEEMKFEDPNIIVRVFVRPQAKVIPFPRTRIIRIINIHGEPVCDAQNEPKKSA